MIIFQNLSKCIIIRNITCGKIPTLKQPVYPRISGLTGCLLLLVMSNHRANKAFLLKNATFL